MTKLRYEFWILPVFAGAALAYAAWLQEPVLWFLTYLSLLCAVLILVYKLRDWRGIEIVRTFRTRQQILEAGSEVRVMLVAKVSSYLPWPWLGVRDNVPADLADKVMGRRAATWFGPGAEGPVMSLTACASFPGAFSTGDRSLSNREILLAWCPMRTKFGQMTSWWYIPGLCP